MLQYHIHRLLEETLLQFSNSLLPIQHIWRDKILRLFEKSGMKYWDNPILTNRENKRYWGTAGVYILSNIISLLRKKKLLEILLILANLDL